MRHICESNEIKIYKPFTQKWYGRQWTEKWATPRKYHYDIWSAQYSGLLSLCWVLSIFFLHTHTFHSVCRIMLTLFFLFIESPQALERNPNKLWQTNGNKMNHIDCQRCWINCKTDNTQINCINNLKKHLFK